MKVTGDLERIGDYAANVAKRSIVLAQYPSPISLAGLAHMAHLVQEQLKSIIDALGAGDTGKAVDRFRVVQVHEPDPGQQLQARLNTRAQ